MAKIKKTVRISENSDAYLSNLAAEKNISYAEALEIVIQKSASNNNDFINEFIKNYDDKYKNLFTRVRLSSTMADRNGQVIIELLNTMLLHFNIRHATTTDTRMSKPLEEAQNTVKNRVEYYKQKKDNK